MEPRKTVVKPYIASISLPYSAGSPLQRAKSLLNRLLCVLWTLEN